MTARAWVMADIGLRIAIVTTMRDEGPFLLEWIAHHRALGVTDFLIYSNDCTDGTDTLLDRLADAGIVVHARNDKRAGKSVQWTALAAASVHPVVQEVDWVAVMDCDEFINLRPPFDKLADMIMAAGKADAILMPWRLFGHGGQARFDPTPVTERFLRAIPERFGFPLSAMSFKTLVRRAGPWAKLGVHRPKRVGRVVPQILDGSGAPVDGPTRRSDGQVLLPADPIATGWVQLNHYAIRSAEDFLVKRRRGLPNRGAIKKVDAAYWAERNFNTVEDRSIARHRATTAEETARLLALPGVSEAQDDAIARHKAAIAEILSDPEEVRLLGRLMLMPTSVPLDGAEAERLASLYRSAAEKG